MSKLSFGELQQNLHDCKTRLKIKQAQVKSEANELKNEYDEEINSEK